MKSNDSGRFIVKMEVYAAAGPVELDLGTDRESGGDLDRALTLSEEATRLSQEPEILDTLGYVHLKRGEASAAAVVLEKAVSGRESSPSIRYRLGTALSQLGETERAREMLTLALAAGSFPEADEARQELAQLEKR